jgi:hypothetical protein
VNKLAVDIGGKFFGENSNTPLTEIGGIGTLVSIIVNAAFVLSGIVLLFFIIFGGISMIAGAGKDNPEQAAKGKQAISSAALGFIVVFAAYWIVQLIELITGIVILG